MEFKDLSNEKINQSAKKAPKPKETKEVLINDVLFIFDNALSLSSTVIFLQYPYMRL